jgi:hypothetical protein
MRAIIFSFLFFLFLNCVSPETVTAQKIRLRGNKTGGIVVTKGKTRATIDLSADAAGCAYVPPGKHKRDLDEMECTAPPASFKLIDATIKNNQNFLVILTEAMGNCNVCGQCGASEAFALVWLRLDARLRLIKKQAVPISLCVQSISMVSPKTQINDAEDNETLNLSLKAGVLAIEFEKEIYGANDTSVYEFSHLEYNRKTPEKGFVIKTEKRGKSANDDR